MSKMEDESWPVPSNDQRTCKICYGNDEDGDLEEWMTPCKCSGSIKWVHKDCMEKWLDNAPFRQQTHCNTCRFPYKKCWNLKPFDRWRWPSLHLTCWDMVEICLDLYSTFKLIRNTWMTIQGKKSILGQMCYFVFWKTFIFSSRRVEYYKGLGRGIVSSVFEASIQDAN